MGQMTDQRKMIAFVHVPKTAGSSVNKLLKLHDPAGHAHCETYMGAPKAFSSLVQDKNWVSGHVPYDTLRHHLVQATDRPLHFYAAMRNPTLQVMSHYNWIIEIFHRGQRFYDGHPEPIKMISHAIRNSDSDDPKAIIRNLRKYSGLFLNQQSRMILGTRFNWNTGLVIDQLRTYQFVATEESLGTLVAKATDGSQLADTRENTSTYHFDRAVFKTPRIRNFLERYNFLDQTLYRTLKSNRVFK